MGRIGRLQLLIGLSSSLVLPGVLDLELCAGIYGGQGTRDCLQAVLKVLM
ncbi:hypothetical protein LINPERHAP1_LOCUS37734 [Linum perenne]